MSDLVKPVGIFDAGIGSFGIVETVQKYYPKQDLIWFSDRANFPLGKKSPDQLFDVGKSAIEFLRAQGAVQIIVAANVLTMIVLDRLRGAFPDVKLYGVTPPVEQAAHLGDFCVLGVKAMVDDPKLRDFMEARKPSSVLATVANASPLIDELVETGLFVSDPDKTKMRVRDFMQKLSPQQKNAAAYTLSSTHLPWLRFAFESASPDKVFLDPAEELVKKMDLSDEGTGQILALTTENKELAMTQAELQKMLGLIGYAHISLTLVDI